MKDVDICIRYWLYILELNNWNVNTEMIDRNQVVFPSDLEEDKKYYVGIVYDFKTKDATLFHDRVITEEDIIHELLHIKFPKFSETNINQLTKLFVNAIETDYPFV